MTDGVAHVRHWGGFLAAGLSALGVDISLTHVFMAAGLSPFAARPIAIFCAMVTSWGINRTVTFAVKSAPSWAEFGRFAAASFLSQIVNYLVFAAILLAYPGAPPALAIVAASAVAMFVAYAGFRFGVFRSS